MKKINWRILGITCLVTLLPIVLGVIFWQRLPEEIAIHFNIHNEPDNYASKSVAVLGIPLMMAVIQCLLCVITDLQLQRRGRNPKMERVSKWIIPFTTVVLYVFTLCFSLGVELDARRIALLILGLTFIVLGNYLPKTEANNDRERKFNRVSGFGMVVYGIICLISAFLPVAFSLVCLGLLFPAILVFAIFGERAKRG